MKVQGVITAKRSGSKCMDCKDSIVVGEGCMRLSGYVYGKGSLCYKCSKKKISAWIHAWQIRLNDIDSHNKLTAQELADKKLIKDI